MGNLQFSVHIEPEVFYGFIGLFIVCKIAQLIYILKLKNKIGCSIFKDD